MSISKKDLQMLELQKVEEVKRLLRACVESNHPIPQSRRQFLASGLMSFSGFMLAPSLLQLISQSAWAAEVDCGEGAAGTPPAYINIQLAGGPALFANFIPQGNNGSSLDTQMLGMGSSPTVTNLFSNNAPFWFGATPTQGESKMVRALVDILGGDFDNIINQRSAFVGVAAESTDDRDGVNPLDISGMLQAAGVTGGSLPYLLTGNKKDFLDVSGAAIKNRYKGGIVKSANFLIVENLASLESSIGGVPGIVGSSLPFATQQELVKAIESLSKSQVENLARKPSSAESQALLNKLIQCSNKKNSVALNETSNLNVYNDATLASIWSKAATARQTAEGVSSDFGTVIERCALIVGNCLKGLSSAATINLGGYDYHINFKNRTQANTKDYEFGDILGRILRSAKALNRKVFIHVSTDGSLFFPVSSDAFVNWGGDSPKKSMGYIIAYNPVAAPSTSGVTVGSYADKPYQLNHFNDNADVDNTNPIGSLSSQDLCACAVFLNYLNFAGLQSRIDSANLAAVKTKLMDSLPASAGDIFNYFTRIKS